jgi:hypothetical protein
MLASDVARRCAAIALTPIARDAIMMSTVAMMLGRTRTVAAGAIALCASTPLAAQSPTCTPIYGVMSKMFDTPFHLYMTDSAQTDTRLHGGKPHLGEEIWDGKIMYIKSRDKWMKSPIDIAELRKSMSEPLDSGTRATCAHVRDETVNGAPAAMWSIHSVSEDGTYDSNVWISKSRNVVVQADNHLDVGGALGKSHSLQRYEYTNVQAPAGVQ